MHQKRVQLNLIGLQNSMLRARGAANVYLGNHDREDKTLHNFIV
jgi:hypothetical protein